MLTIRPGDALASERTGRKLTVTAVYDHEVTAELLPTLTGLRSRGAARIPRNLIGGDEDLSRPYVWERARKSSHWADFAPSALSRRQLRRSLDGPNPLYFALAAGPHDCYRCDEPMGPDVHPGPGGFVTRGGETLWVCVCGRERPMSDLAREAA